jgi:hypothetical protein
MKSPNIDGWNLTFVAPRGGGISKLSSFSLCCWQFQLIFSLDLWMRLLVSFFEVLLTWFRSNVIELRDCICNIVAMIWAVTICHGCIQSVT